MELLVCRALRGSYAVVLTLLGVLWERALRLGAAYDYGRGPSATALSECDWGGIVVISAVLLPLCLVGLLTLTSSSGSRLFHTAVATVVMPMLALGLFLMLGGQGFVD